MRAASAQAEIPRGAPHQLPEATSGGIAASGEPITAAQAMGSSTRSQLT
ncbi:hypothetical protein ACL03H_12030 [Saccharopolyspora sp. MS10]